MNWLDIVLVLIVVAFAWRCFWLGLIKSLGSLVGLAVGFIAANFTYLKLFTIVKPFFGGLDNIGRAVCFIFLFILLSRLIYMIFVALDKVYDFISIIPFLGVINNLAGGALGIVIGVIFTTILVILATKFFPADGFIGKLLEGSLLSSYLANIISLLSPAIIAIKRAFNILKHGFR
jgi:uncharacterized membrane protein required for colicin V production